MTDEQKAIALYAILDRSIGDFIDSAEETNSEALVLLLSMLELENPTHNARTKSLNKIGANFVKNILVDRAGPVAN